MLNRTDRPDRRRPYSTAPKGGTLGVMNMQRVLYWTALGVTCQAFSLNSPSLTRSSSTHLDAAPTFIIGPMLKKMREEQAKKNMPMAGTDERSQEAPGLRIGRKTWKWPAVWPYDKSLFQSVAESKPQEPSEDGGSEEAKEVFNSMTYWGVQEAATATPLDGECQEQLRSHFDFYLRDGMSILELGAATNSYLPQGFTPSRHVGVGANMEQMNQNPSLTDKLIVDLNNAIEDRDVDSDELRTLSKEPFDAIIMSNTVQYLTSPREVFRSAWYLLKPGGVMYVAFPGKDAMNGIFKDAESVIWNQYNDDQHLWITGSFFQFSAGDGWESLLGFDISPESAKGKDGSPLSNLLNQKKNNKIFVVQATKGFQDQSIDLDNIERSVNSLSWMLPTLEDRDKKLVVARLTRALETSRDPVALKTVIERNIVYLPVVYEDALKRMDQFAFTFTMQSQMAAELVCDPDFCGSKEQILSLKEGLGLRTPQETFWKPVGQYTAAIGIEDKISLLGFLVPRFGNSGKSAALLEAFVSGLQPTNAMIEQKCPEMTPEQVQLLSSELLACEVTQPTDFSRQDFACLMSTFTPDELRDLLKLRLSFRQAARDDLLEYRRVQEEEAAKVVALREKMEEQIRVARETRSLYFNPRTEKMEILDNPQNKE